MPAVLDVTGEKNGVLVGERSIRSGTSLIGTTKTFSITYYVQADDIGDNEDDIMDATGIPELLSIRNGAFLKSKEAREIDASALLWEVVCKYSSEVDGGGDISTGASAVNWFWGSETIEEVLERDPLTGESITNSVGEPIIITGPVTIPVLTIERLQDPITGLTILAYVNRTNSHPFWNAPIGTALMSSIDESPEVSDGVRRARVRYVIKFNLTWDESAGEYKGWKSRPLNEGLKYLLNKDDNISDALPFLAEETPVSGNLNLDGTQNYTKNFVHLEFNRHLIANFNTLNLGPYA